MNEYLIRLALVVGSATMTLLLTETILRTLTPGSEINYGWGLDQEDLDSFRKAFQARLSSGRETGQLRILLLGDSQVQNRGTSPPILPATILESELNSLLAATCLMDGQGAGINVAVLSLGREGWGQDQELLALEAVAGAARPHLVLTWFTPENDLWNNSFPTHYPRNGTPKPTFVLDGEQLVLMQKRDILPIWTGLRLVAASKRATDKAERILRGLRGANGEFSSHFPLRFDPDGKWDREYLPEGKTIPVAAGSDRDDNAYLSLFNPYFRRDPIDLEKSHLAIGMNPSSPRIDYMTRLTSSLIGETRSTAKRLGSEYAVFYYSTEMTNRPLYPPDGDYVARGYEFTFSNPSIRERLARIFQDVHSFRIELLQDDWRKPNNDPHLTTSGNRFVMETLSRLLLESGFLCDIVSEHTLGGRGADTGAFAPADIAHERPYVSRRARWGGWQPGA